MRQNRRVKQKMYYSNYRDSEPIYVTDDEGNIIYDEMPDGELIPRTDGETEAGYTEPKEFYNSITGTLTEDEIRAFGNEAIGNAKMTFLRGEYDFQVGTLIWKDSPVRFNDGAVDETSADYRITGIDKTGQHYNKAILSEVT